MKTRLVSATEFKAKCLALLAEIEDGGESITITKRGRPMAVVGPASRRAWKSPEGCWAGRVKLPKSLDSIETSELWDVVRGKS